jgi:hypothetical protein
MNIRRTTIETQTTSVVDQAAGEDVESINLTNNSTIVTMVIIPVEKRTAVTPPRSKVQKFPQPLFFSVEHHGNFEFFHTTHSPTTILANFLRPKGAMMCHIYNRFKHAEPNADAAALLVCLSSYDFHFVSRKCHPEQFL